MALEHLTTITQICGSELGGDSPEEMADLYEKGAYRADQAALRAFTATSYSDDREAVVAVLRSIYLPWLDAAAIRFQKLVENAPLPGLGQPMVEAAEGECILFVDGLRYDVAQQLAVSLEHSGDLVRQERRWSALPSVTPTAKPAISPLLDELGSGSLPPDFMPPVKAEGKPLTIARFERILKGMGYTVIKADEMIAPIRPDSKAWSEFGQIDGRGHKMQSDLADILDREVSRLTERVTALLQAGWRSIRIVTDHGWLLMPGSLPKHELPHYLVESRWTRCATIKGESQVDVPVSPWHWNPQEHFASPPGICCFINGNEYSHGGLSLQECLLPVLIVETDQSNEMISGRILKVEWRRQRCKITVETDGPRIQADIRRKASEADSSVAATIKVVAENDNVSLIVEDEDLAGESAVIVLIDDTGRVLHKHPTIIGENH